MRNNRSDEVTELRARVAALEDRLQNRGPTRRQVLLGGAALGGGLLSLGSGEAEAAMGDGDTQWGSDTNRADYYADHVDGNVIETPSIIDRETGTTYDVGDDLAGGGAGGKPFATIVVAASDATTTTGADYICDGTDDQVTINSAIDDLSTTGGTVVLTDGQYSLTGAVSMDQNGVTLTGQGWSTHLFLEGGNQSDVITVRANNNTVEKLRVDGNAANQTDSADKENQLGVDFTNSPDFTIRNTWVINTFYSNIRSESDAPRARIVNNYCDGVTGQGSDATHNNVSISDPNGYGSVIANNILLNAGANTTEGHGIESSNTDYVVIADNYIENTHVGISPHDAIDNTIAGNVMQDVNWGIWGDIAHTPVIGNTMRGGALGGNRGIYMKSTAEMNPVIGNHVHGFADQGIYITNQDMIIMANTVDSAGDHGIEVTASNSIVAWNRVRNSTNQDIVDGGTNNRVAFNVTDDGSGAGYTVSSTQPSNPNANDIWFDTS